MNNEKENQNQDEEKSNHPEMNEDYIEVSDDVPNTVEELIDRQDRFRIDFVEEEEIEQDDLRWQVIERDEEKMSKISKEILKILHKNNAGPNEDLKLSILLLNRIKRFQEFLRKKMEIEDDIQKELLINISEDIMKLKLILKLLEEGI